MNLVKAPLLSDEQRMHFHAGHRLAIDGCWEWKRSKTKFGYGQFTVNKIHILAHRMAYAIFYGEVPTSLCVLHRCDNPSCVNPEHLFLGTYLDNNRDMSLKRRSVNARKTHCKRGHELVASNLWENRGNTAKRACKQCSSLVKRQWRMERREKGLTVT